MLSYIIFTAIYEVGTVVIIPQMMKLRLKEVNLSKAKSKNVVEVGSEPRSVRSRATIYCSSFHPLDAAHFAVNLFVVTLCCPFSGVTDVFSFIEPVRS